MFVTWEDFEDWEEEQIVRELENEFADDLDFLAREKEFDADHVSGQSLANRRNAP